MNDSFIIYENKALSNLDKPALKDVLDRCSLDKRIVTLSDDVYTIEKIVDKNNMTSVPHKVKDVLSVNVFDDEDMTNFVVNQGFNIVGKDKVIDTLYLTKDMSMFEMFTKYVSFNAVFSGDSLLVINGKENNYMRLYYGFSRINDSLMFSNNKEILSKLSSKVYDMPFDSYYMNGEIVSLNRDVKKFILK